MSTSSSQSIGMYRLQNSEHLLSTMFAVACTYACNNCASYIARIYIPLLLITLTDLPPLFVFLLLTIISVSLINYYPYLLIGCYTLSVFLWGIYYHVLVHLRLLSHRWVKEAQGQVYHNYVDW
jgi:hypothetical protein